MTEGEPGDKGEAFARESGSNTYTINVENVGTETAGTIPRVGETLRCAGGPRTGASLAYRWLRGGTDHWQAPDLSTYDLAEPMKARRSSAR